MVYKIAFTKIIVFSFSGKWNTSRYPIESFDSLSTNSADCKCFSSILMKTVVSNRVSQIFPFVFYPTVSRNFLVGEAFSTFCNFLKFFFFFKSFLRSFGMYFLNKNKIESPTPKDTIFYILISSPDGRFDKYCHYQRLKNNDIITIKIIN